MRKLLTTILVIALVVTMAISSIPVFADENIISIATYADLQSAVSGAEAAGYYAGKTLQLTADIALGDDWTPFTTFKGTFDGGNKTIQFSTNANKLFAKMEGATIKNLVLTGDVTIGFTVANTTWGFLTGLADGTNTIENVVNKASATTSLKNGDALATGWICCAAFIGDTVATGDVIFKNCINEGDITTTTSSSGYAAGFVGRSRGNATFTNCTNKGIINGNETAGGFIAQMNTAGKALVCTNCSNVGSIDGGRYSGGFIGDIRTTATMTNCRNTGDVLADFAGTAAATISTGAGGFIGQSNTNYKYVITIKNAYNSGKITCKNLIAGGYSGCAGGLIGWHQMLTNVDGFVNEGTIEAAYAAGEIVGAYAQYLASANNSIKNCYCGGNVVSVEGKNASLLGKVFGFFGSKFANATTIMDNIYYSSTTLSAIAGITTWAAGNAGTSTTTSVNGVEVKQDSMTMANYVTALNAEIAKGNKEDNSTALKSMIDSKVTESKKLDIHYEGIQTRASGANTMDIRFVTTIQSLSYLKVGFELVCFENEVALGSLSQETDVVYRSLNALGADGIVTKYTADQFNGEYFAALKLTNVPNNKNLTFVIRPYIVDQDSGKPVYGTDFTISIENGTLTTQY